MANGAQGKISSNGTNGRTRAFTAEGGINGGLNGPTSSSQ